MSHCTLLNEAKSPLILVVLNLNTFTPKVSEAYQRYHETLNNHLTNKHFIACFILALPQIIFSQRPLQCNKFHHM